VSQLEAGTDAHVAVKVINMPKTIACRFEISPRSNSKIAWCHRFQFTATSSAEREIEQLRKKKSITRRSIVHKARVGSSNCSDCEQTRNWFNSLLSRCILRQLNRRRSSDYSISELPDILHRWFAFSMSKVAFFGWHDDEEASARLSHFALLRRIVLRRRRQTL
jgi:hypothetical protein